MKECAREDRQAITKPDSKTRHTYRETERKHEAPNLVSFVQSRIHAEHTHTHTHTHLFRNQAQNNKIHFSLFEEGGGGLLEKERESHLKKVRQTDRHRVHLCP